ncbi:fused MFS/spermidine synthase [Gemmatimonadota bacterium]
MTLILCAIFFISGASALVFETLWFFQAGIAFGNSVWASSLVLAGFMGGLALGSAIAVRRGDRLGPPIRTYAVLEIVIAVSGVLLVWTLPSMGTVATPLLQPFLDVPWVLNPLRLLFAFSLLLVPSTAMGLTLPLLTQALVKADPNFGRVLGRLYGWNTLGAVAGAVLAEILLVELLGIRGSAFAAGALNLLAAASALLLVKSLRQPSTVKEEVGTEIFQWTKGARWLGAAFLSGFSLLALEVVWFRFLLLYVIGTSLSFSVMLAVVLAGISLGGLFASVWLRKDAGAHRYAVSVAFAAGVFCTATYGLFPNVVGFFGVRALRGISDVLIVSAPLMFPVSFLSGIFFTLAGAALRKTCPSATTTTGILTLANTTGAAVGAFAGGFFLLPVAGIESSFLVLSVLYGVIALLVLKKGTLASPYVYSAIGTYIVTMALFPAGAMPRHHLTTAAARWAGDNEWQVVEYREGLSETIIYVEELMFEKPQFLRLVTNSLSMSSTRFNARRYMKLYVYWPVAIHPNPKTALLISYGVGSTAKALTETESFEEIDVVDISRDVLEMNSIVFPDSNENPLHDPRVSVHIEDGRYFLRTTDKSFDLITGEPPPPEIATVVNLYTQEYFQLIYDRLNEGGIVTYWLPLHSLSDRSAKAIIKAFSNVFSDASLWHGWREDVMLVGTRGAHGPVPLDHLERQWQEPQIAAEMKSDGIENPDQLGALFIGDSDYLDELTEGVLPLVDNFPKRILADSVLGHGASQLYASMTDTDAARARFTTSSLIRDLWPEPLIERTIPYFEFQRILESLIDVSGHPLARDMNDLHLVLSQSPLTAPALWHMGSTSDVQASLEHLSSEELEVPLWQYQIGAGLFADRKYLEANEALQKAEEHPALFGTSRLFRIYSLCLLSQIDAAKDLADDTYPDLAQETNLEHWWDFLNEKFGIDPRSEASRN